MVNYPRRTLPKGAIFQKIFTDVRFVQLQVAYSLYFDTKKTMIKLLSTLCLCLLLASCWAQEPKTNEFVALQNTWHGAYGNGTFTETWKVIDENTLEGWAYYVVKADTVLNEYLQIRKTGAHWGYLASINGSPPTLFNLKESHSNNWTFTNSEHDFPQVVYYEISPEGQLRVTVSGVMNGKETKDHYRLDPISAGD